MFAPGHRDPVRGLVERRHPAQGQHQHGARSPLCRHALRQRAGRRAISTRSTSSRTTSSTSSERRRRTCRRTSPPAAARRSRYTGALPARRRCRSLASPAPTLVAHFNGTTRRPTPARSGRTANLNCLTKRNPNPVRSRRTTCSATRPSATTRRPRVLPANFFVANPDQIGGAFVVANEGTPTTTRCRSNCAAGSRRGCSSRPATCSARRCRPVPVASRATRLVPRRRRPGRPHAPVQGERRLRPAVRPGPPVHGGAGRGHGAPRRRLADRDQHAVSRAAGWSISATCAWSAWTRGRCAGCVQAALRRCEQVDLHVAGRHHRPTRSARLA